MRIIIILITYIVLLNSCINEKVEKVDENETATFLNYRRGNISLDTIKYQFARDSSNNFKSFNYRPYDSLKSNILFKFNDSLCFLTYGKETEQLDLIKKAFNIFNKDDIIYIYSNINPPIDGHMLYVVSEKYGLLYMKSTTWRNFTSLSSLESKTTLKNEEFAFIIYSLYNHIGSIMVRGYDVDEYINYKLNNNP